VERGTGKKVLTPAAGREAVGVLEDDIVRLAREHLQQFQFRDEFRPDTSLYDHAERAFGNVISLREHFRCVPEIIRFSNDLGYTDAPLIPLRRPPPKRLPPLKREFVDKGNCEGEGQRIINRAEAEAIVHKIQECLKDEPYEGKTMGVIVPQGHAQAELSERKLAGVLEPKVREERKLRCGVPTTFQGDQRDVIFLSLVVPPNHSFRAMTGLPDQRRLNVAMSRARDQVWLFHSVQFHDLSHEDLRWRLLNFFSSRGQVLEVVYEELDRLERAAQRPARRPGEQPNPYESWFEVDVALELLRKKYRVHPQVEVAGYGIDLVVEGLNNRLAVERDGDNWHGPEAYTRDIARQRQPERAGWKFVRIRESEFYANRKDAVRRIVKACEALDIRPVGDKEPERYQASAGAVSGGEEVSLRSHLNRALYSMQKAGEIAVEDELGDRSLESEVVRLGGAPREGASPPVPPDRDTLLARTRRTGSLWNSGCFGISAASDSGGMSLISSIVGFSAKPWTVTCSGDVLIVDRKVDL